MVTRADFKSQDTLDRDGADTARDVYASVGYALSIWESMETTLASLFAYLCGPTRNNTAFRAYGTLTATLPRKKMIEAAAEMFFIHFPSTALEKRLYDLLVVYADAGGRRNEIAHGIVMGPMLHTIVASVAVPLPTKWFLYPATHNTKNQSFNLRPEYQFNCKTIDKYTKAFDGLTADIIAFRKDLIAHYDSFPEKERARY